jgi:ribonuclease E
MELSRQRLRPSLVETNFVTCHTCQGAGRVRSVESMALYILRALEEEGIKRRAIEVNLFTHTKVAFYLLNQKRAALNDIEKRYGFSVMIFEDDDHSHAQFFRLERVRQRTAQDIAPSYDHLTMNDDLLREEQAPVSDEILEDDIPADLDDSDEDEGEESGNASRESSGEKSEGTQEERRRGRRRRGRRGGRGRNRRERNEDGSPREGQPREGQSGERQPREHQGHRQHGEAQQSSASEQPSAPAVPYRTPEPTPQPQSEFDMMANQMGVKKGWWQRLTDKSES